MNEKKDTHNPNVSQGDNIGKFQITKRVYLKEKDAFLYQLDHLPTKARYLHFSNNDSENTFAVGLKTVPADSTGVAHILEHTVLCGSKKYPVRDPFFSMLKRSLNTFMNAFTASDWTMYPFSSQNKKDFYNLLDVYLDAVFFPNIDELSFKQEGHRLEIEQNQDNPEDFSLVYKGVVYNEMKGAMSSPYEVLTRSLMNALYPDTTYRFNSGGDPKEIPRLTHEQLKAFHQRHYHPSNAFFYTYGNLPLKGHLDFIQEKVLKHFDEIDPDTHVPSQKRWDKEKKVSYAYALSKTESPEKKYQAGMAWLMADIKNTFDVLSLLLLERILLANAASPLRKALIDSNLGTALSDGTGYDHENRDTLFACGLKDVNASSSEKIRTIIFKTLEDLVTNGIDPSLIESAIHQLEFHHKEVTNTPYPYGLRLILQLAANWFHGADPVRVFRFDDDIAKIRAGVSSGGFFENMIRKYFLENRHRVLFTLVPDQSLEETEAKYISEELAQIKAQLSVTDIDKIKKDQKALARLQDSAEDPSCLPTLALSDIPPDVTLVEESKTPDSEAVGVYPQPTSGILYFLSVLGIHDIPEQTSPLVPVFSYLFPKIGTRKRDYVEMARLMDAHTGGIAMSANTGTEYQTKSCVPFFSLTGKCLNRNQARLFDIMEELIFEFSPSDLERIKTLLLQYRAGQEARVVQNGHRLAISLASRYFSEKRFLDECWHGIHQLSAVKKMTDNMSEPDLERLVEELKRINEMVFARQNMTMALIGEKDVALSASQAADALWSRLSKNSSPAGGDEPVKVKDALPNEGWSTSSAVSFVASAFKTVPMGHDDAPALFVTSKLLRSLYLHREIREKGGAYGGFALYNLEDGIFSLASYRDPHIVSTLKVFGEVEKFLKSGGYDDEDIKEAILQVCSEIDRPDSPGMKGQKAFLRKIIGLTDEERRRFKKGVLSVTRDQVAGLVDKYFNTDHNQRAVAVISSESRLEEASKRLAQPLDIHQI